MSLLLLLLLLPLLVVVVVVRVRRPVLLLPPLLLPLRLTTIIRHDARRKELLCAALNSSTSMARAFIICLSNLGSTSGALYNAPEMFSRYRWKNSQLAVLIGEESGVALLSKLSLSVNLDCLLSLPPPTKFAQVFWGFPRARLKLRCNTLLLRYRL